MSCEISDYGIEPILRKMDGQMGGHRQIDDLNLKDPLVGLWKAVCLKMANNRGRR